MVTPSSGSPGVPVTISGSNFDPTPANNLVCFGTGPATVVSASGSSLDVTVPPGATTARITVTVNLLIGYSNTPFCILSGDVTNDLVTDIVDIVALIQDVVFSTPLPNPTAGDTNCDTVRDIVDIVLLIQYVVFGSPTPCCM